VAVVAIVSQVGTASSQVAPRGDAAASKFAGKPIVIGRPEGQTGYLKLYDGPVTQAIRLAIKDVNAQGGVLGRPLKLITADTKTQISTVPAAALDVIGKGAQILMPSWDYDLGAPAARLGVQKKMLVVSGAGSPNYGLRGIGKTFFNVENGTPTEGSTLAEWAYMKMKWRHPYVLQDTSIEYTKDGCKYFVERWKQLAGDSSIAGQDTFLNADAAIPAQVSRLKGAGNADFIYICSYPPGGASAVKQIRSAGINKPIIGPGGGFDGNYWFSSVPGLSNFYDNVSGSLFHDDPSKAINKLFDRMQKLTGSRPNNAEALEGYAAIQVIVAAIKKVKSCCNGTALANALVHAGKIPTVLGPVHFSSTCHIAGKRRVRIIKVTNGKAKYLTTWTPRKIPAAAC